jgi:hypothetical protein
VLLGVVQTNFARGCNVWLRTRDGLQRSRYEWLTGSATPARTGVLPGAFLDFLCASFAQGPSKTARQAALDGAVRIIQTLAIASVSAQKTPKMLIPIGASKAFERKMVPSTRIERVTLPLGGGCSIH